MTPWDLIWTGRSLELAGLEDLGSTDWVGATQADIQQYIEQNTLLRQMTAAGPPIPEACVVMMVKDEAYLIAINLRWLHRLGIRKFVILDNKSTDGTSTILRMMRDTLTDCELIIVDDATVRYTQSEKTTGLMRLAESFWPDVKWTFPIDADEILCCQDGLAKLREVSQETQVIVLQKVNHYLAEGSGRPVFGEAKLDTMPCRTHLGGQPPKIALRPSSEATIVQGNHDVKFKDARRVAYAPGLQFGLYYREFQFRSFEQFKRKIINGGRALVAAERHTGRSSGGDHWKAWFGTYEKQGDEGLLAVFRSIAIRSVTDLTLDPLMLS
jgi:hypothetical protein